jgi:hypothetical protein
MKPQANDPVLPQGCQNTLAAIELDPLNLPHEALKHITTCPKCFEARVMWLAQEDFEAPIAPTGYFDKLPGRILQKMPATSASPWFRVPLLASAASILFFAGLSGYWYGRQANHTTIVLEAVVPPRDAQDPFLQDLTSFSSIELFSQAPNLTQDEIRELMKDLQKPEASVQPTKPGGD